MAYYIGLKSIRSYVIFISVLAYILIYHDSEQPQREQDAESAIKRARTQTCRRELENFASKRLVNIAQHLRRSCPLDRNIPRNSLIGCLSNQSRYIIKLDQFEPTNASICWDLCFSYDHSHAGYHESDRRCYCGDDSSVLDIQINKNCSEHLLEWHKIDNGIYRPPDRRPSYHRPENGSDIKIAFLLTLSGRSKLQVLRLINSIYSENHIYYIHIDKRDNYLFHKLGFLEKEFQNVVIARTRFATIWGSPNLLKMIVESMRHLLNENWDYLVNLSESDFPLKPLTTIERYLASSDQSIFLKGHNMRGCDFIKKQGLDRDFYQCDDRVWMMGRRQLPLGIVYSGGSDWFALPKDLCSYIVANLNNSDTLVEPLVRLYHQTLLPAESFFHTLVLNSKFCARFSGDNLRLTNWNRKKNCWCQHRDVVDWCGCSPVNYRRNDWKKLAQTKSSQSLLLSRKFDPTISLSVINELERNLLGNPKTKLQGLIEQLDHRYWLSIYDSTEVQRSSDDDVIFLEQFGLYVLRQMSGQEERIDHMDMRKVAAFFEDDRFKGLIFEFANVTRSLKFVVNQITDNLVHDYNAKCFIDSAQDLKVIEVNHGFDINERMFRDYRPISARSDIIVYHEWKVRNMTESRLNESYIKSSEIKFIWKNSNNQIELIQDVKLKAASKSTRLILAHRLNTRKPHRPGVWILNISVDGVNCLKYRFLVLDDAVLSNLSIPADTFGKFYRVTDSCVTHMGGIKTATNTCHDKDWILRTNLSEELNKY